MKERILIIEDDESLAFSFKKVLLEEEGYEIVTIHDYNKAIYSVSNEEFDLIFIDVVLNGNSGIDILREARNRNLVCPVIIITGKPDIGSATEAVRLGAYDYLTKPVRSESLIRHTKMALRHKTVLEDVEKYRTNIDAIFRNVKDGIITVDKELKVLESNNAAQTICGISIEEDKGKSLALLLEEGCNGKCLAPITETMKTKEPVTMRDFECERKLIANQIVSLSTFPLIDNHDKFYGCGMIVRDETRLTGLEHDLHERQQLHNIIGKSDKMQSIYSLIDNLTDVQTTVLITGESGTGKEMVAEAIHYRGERAKMPLVKVNCAALSDNLLESELFGHVKGAFTGATKDRIGRFQMADGGTILLDEIGDISNRMQLRLLRVLQEMEFERVGDSVSIKIDVRVIAATNQDLNIKIRQGKFREDLYHRLSVIVLKLPPLRDRCEDIPLLVEHFLEKLNIRHKKMIKGISDDVLNLFVNYKWPGNVRELLNKLEHAFVICHKSLITVDNLPPTFNNSNIATPQSKKKSTIDSKTISDALKMAGGNKAKASRLLHISRWTLYDKLKKYNIKHDEV